MREEQGKEEKTMALEEETKRFVYAHFGPGNHSTTTSTIQSSQDRSVIEIIEYEIKYAR